METPSDNIRTNEDFRNNTSTFVIGLQPPPLASAYERVVWRDGTTAGADPSHTYQRLNIVTTRGPTAKTDSEDDSMDSGHSSPDHSTQGLVTPIDSPKIPSLSIKDEVDDTHHIVHRERAPHTDHASRSGPSVSESLELSNAVISTTFAPSRHSDKPVQSQGYTISIDVLEDAFDLKSGTTHELLVDTGCDDTFCFGRGVMRVVSDGRKDSHGVSTERIDWDLAKALTSRMLHTTIQHRFDPRLANEELEARGNIIGQIDFADGTTAQLGLLQDPRTWAIPCYDWQSKEQRTVYLNWQFGVAFAVDVHLMKDSTSGILGLGPHYSQRAYRLRPNAPEPPTFLQELRQCLKPIPSTRRGEDFAIYFALRLAPQAYRRDVFPIEHPIQSWLSFNGWPCTKEPRWNEQKIIVCQPKHPDDASRWEVYLKSMKFLHVSSSAVRPSPSVKGWPGMDFVDDQRPRGLRVLLDTGSSVSYLPSPFVEQFCSDVFYGGNTPVEDIMGEEFPEDFELPAWVESDERKVEVLYEFEGAGGQSVQVYGPFEKFFYQKDLTRSGPHRRLEGLMFPQRPSDSHGVFGLNFFQSMYVSLHQAKNGLDFVRMAAQWPENFKTDLRDYEITGLSAT